MLTLRPRDSQLLKATSSYVHVWCVCRARKKRNIPTTTSSAPKCEAPFTNPSSIGIGRRPWNPALAASSTVENISCVPSPLIANRLCRASANDVSLSYRNSFLASLSLPPYRKTERKHSFRLSEARVPQNKHARNGSIFLIAFIGLN